MWAMIHDRKDGVLSASGVIYGYWYWVCTLNLNVIMGEDEDVSRNITLAAIYLFMVSYSFLINFITRNNRFYTAYQFDFFTSFSNQTENNLA